MNNLTHTILTKRFVRIKRIFFPTVDNTLQWSTLPDQINILVNFIIGSRLNLIKYFGIQKIKICQSDNRERISITHVWIFLYVWSQSHHFLRCIPGDWKLLSGRTACSFTAPHLCHLHRFVTTWSNSSSICIIQSFIFTIHCSSIEIEWRVETGFTSEM